MGIFRSFLSRTNSPRRRHVEYRPSTLEALEGRLLLDGIPPLLNLTAVPDIDIGAPYFLRADATPQHAQDSITEYIIDWDDGSGLVAIPTSAQTVTRSHRYTSAGDYTVTVRAIDDDGDEATETINVSVQQFTIDLAPVGSVILTSNDDGSTAAQAFGFDFEFFGQAYTQFYINNNGNITFDSSFYSYTPSGFPQSFDNPMIAPFWADVDTRNSASAEVHLATGTSSRGNPFVQIDWPGVGYYGMKADKLNDFTLYIEDDPGGDIVAFVYGSMGWTTGDVSGSGGFGTSPAVGAQIGYDASDGEHYVSFGRPYSLATLATFTNTQIIFRVSEGPTVDDLWLQTGQDTPIDGQVVGQDPEDDPLTFSVVSDPDDGSVTMAADGSFTYLPDLGFYGSDSFTFIATDPGDMTSNIGTVTILVNDPPTADDLAWETDEDSVDAAGQTTGDDIQPGWLRYRLDTDVTHGTLNLRWNGSFTYTPDANFNGTDSFQFHVNDGYSDSAVADVTITVNPVNDAPSADDQSTITPQNGVVVLDLAASDLETDADDLVFTITQAPAHGGYVQVGSQITYTANTGYAGTDIFRFTVTDTGDPAGGDQGWGFAAALTSAPATVSIGVPTKQDFDPDGTLTLDLLAGREATFTIRGNGTASVYHFIGVAFSTTLDVTSVVLSGTDADSVLSIRPTGALLIGNIIVDGGSLQAIDAKTTDLAGDVQVLNGSLAKMNMQNVSDGVLTVGVAPAGATLSIGLQQVSDFGVSSVMPIKKLSAVEWLNEDATADQIAVPWVSRLAITGRRANARRGVAAADGDFCADLILSGTGLAADDVVLANAKIKGAISGGTWQITGPTKSIAAGGMQQANLALTHSPSSAVPALRRLKVGMVEGTHFTSTGDLGNMTIGGMVDSNLFAGVINWVAGDGLPDPETQIDTPVALGGTGGHATIRRVNIRGAKTGRWYTANFANSNVAAYDVGTVKLRNGDLTSTGTDFGVAAWQAKRISYADRNRANKWTWPSRGRSVLTSDSDLTINLGIVGAESFVSGERVIRDRAGDGGFSYTDITAVSLRPMSDWAHIAIATANPLSNALAQNVTVRIKLDTNADFVSLLDEDDRSSDYYVDWSLTDDQITLWTGGGHKTPDVWTEIDAPTAFSKLTDSGVVIAVPLSALDDPSPLRPDRIYEYVKVVGVTISKGTSIVDSAGK